MDQPEELDFVCKRCGDDDCNIGEPFCPACGILISNRLETLLAKSREARDAGKEDESEAYLSLSYLVKQPFLDDKHFENEMFLDALAWHDKHEAKKLRPHEQN